MRSAILFRNQNRPRVRDLPELTTPPYLRLKFPGLITPFPALIITFPSLISPLPSLTPPLPSLRFPRTPRFLSLPMTLLLGRTASLNPRHLRRQGILVVARISSHGMLLLLGRREVTANGKERKKM
jgi:hypothetical protein